MDTEQPELPSPPPGATRVKVLDPGPEGVKEVIAVRTTGDEAETVNLTEDDLRIISQATGTPLDKIKDQDIKVTPKFLEMLREGKIQMVPKGDPAPEGMRVMSQKEVQGQGPPGASAPPTPRSILQANYANVLKQALREDQTAHLPQTRVGLSVDPEAVNASGSIPNDQRPIISAYMEFHTRLKRQVLANRKSGAPSILEEVRGPIKLMVSQHQSPGDIMMLTRAVDDLHRTYPGRFRTKMRTPCGELWQNNPYHSEDMDDNDPEAMWLACEYKLINTSNDGAHHFVHGFRRDLEAKLGIPINQSYAKGAVYLTDQEKHWFSQIHEKTGRPVPFWIIDAGSKSDYTAKQWSRARFQEVVDRTPHIQWVQVGAQNHNHEPLTGDNLINLVGETTIRKFMRLMYHAAGVLTPVSFPMHLSAAVEMHPMYKRRTRPTIVLAGGREPTMWEAYSTHQYLHTCGALPCNSHGGCWKSRAEPLLDGDKKDYHGLCERPVVAENGQVVPKCMDLITVDQVIAMIDLYSADFDYTAEDFNKWFVKPHETPQVVKDKIAESHSKRASGEIKMKADDGTGGATPEPGKDISDKDKEKADEVAVNEPAPAPVVDGPAPEEPEPQDEPEPEPGAEPEEGVEEGHEAPAPDVEPEPAEEQEEVEIAGPAPEVLTPAGPPCMTCPTGTMLPVDGNKVKCTTCGWSVDQEALLGLLKLYSGEGAQDQEEADDEEGGEEGEAVRD